MVIWGALKLGHFHTTPPLQEGFQLSFGVHPTVIAVFTLAQMNCTRAQNWT